MATGAKVFCHTNCSSDVFIYFCATRSCFPALARCSVTLHILQSWTSFTDCFMSPVSVFLCAESSPSSAHGPTSSRSTRLPRRTGFPPVSMLSPCPTSSTVPGMYIGSSAWMDPRCVYGYIPSVIQSQSRNLRLWIPFANKQDRESWGTIRYVKNCKHVDHILHVSARLGPFASAGPLWAEAVKGRWCCHIYVAVIILVWRCRGGVSRVM